MISFNHKGDYKKTKKFLSKASDLQIESILNRYGQMGVDYLAANTPRDTGLTASLWSFNIKKTRGSMSINWTNSHVVSGVPIAIILQYGHGTRNGGYVQGQDYINPATRIVFDQIAEEVWREVTSK